MQPTVTIAQARQAAFEAQLRTDARLRDFVERMNVMRAKTIDPDCGADSVCAVNLFLFNMRRLWNVDALPGVRCRLMGPRWRQHFGVEQRPIDEVRPPWMNECRVGRRWVLVFTLEQDVRELVTTAGAGAPEPDPEFDELRPGVFAMFEDPRDA